MTCGPAAASGAAELELDAPGLDLLLEQPANAAATMATPTTPAVMPRFITALLRCRSLCDVGRVIGGWFSPRRPHVRDPSGAAGTRCCGLQTIGNRPYEVPGGIRTRRPGCCVAGNTREPRWPQSRWHCH